MYSRFSSLEERIRLKGKVKSWRHTYCDEGMTHRSVGTVEIDRPAILVGPNTWAYMVDADTVGIQFHNTEILHVKRDGSAELACSYQSVTTQKRYKEFGISTYTENYSGFFCVGSWEHGLRFPLMAGMSNGLTVTATMCGLLNGARTGDAAACMALAREIETAGFPRMAEAVRTLRGDTWGRKQRDAKKAWDDYCGATVGGVWFADSETLQLIAPVTQRDILVHQFEPSIGAKVTIDGKLMILVNGWTGDTE